MRREYFKVTGTGPWTIDHPPNVTKAHRPGDTFEASPLNPGVVRGLRKKRLRQLDWRESRAIRNRKPKPVTPKKGPPPPPPADPIVILDDDPLSAE